MKISDRNTLNNINDYLTVIERASFNMNYGLLGSSENVKHLATIRANVFSVRKAILDLMQSLDDEQIKGQTDE